MATQGPFLVIFCQNYIDAFHKTENQMVILRCLVCLDPDWIKSNEIIPVKIFFFQNGKKPEMKPFVFFVIAFDPIKILAC